jgi:hypothetical protein
MSINIGTGQLVNAYEDGYKNPVKSWLPDVSVKVDTTDEKVIQAVVVGDSGPLEKWVEGQERGTRELNRYKLEMEKELNYDSFLIPASAYHSNPKIFDSKAQETGSKGTQKVEAKVIDWLNTNPKCLSGLSVFNTAHVMGESGTINNDVAKAQVGVLQVAAPTAPTDIEASKIVVALISRLKNYKNDAGLPDQKHANKFVLFVNTEVYEAAFKAALTLEYLTGGASNPLYQMIKTGVYSVDIYFEPNLTGTNKIVLINATEGNQPFVLATGRPEDISDFDKGSYGYKKRSAYEFAVKMDLAFGALFPQRILRATLST